MIWQPSSKKRGSKMVAAMNPVEVLDRLIAASIDSEKRYRHAAKDVGRVSLEAFMNWQADNRKAAADELNEERTSLGGNGHESGTWNGLVDRAALDISVAMSKGDTGVAEWCKEDDQAVVAEYESALQQDLPEHLRRLLERQLGLVKGAVNKLAGVLSVFGEPRS